MQSTFIWKKNTTYNEKYNFTQDKSGFAVALISNCMASSDRLIFIEEVQKYAPVKIYGKCGGKCPTHFKNNILGDCREIIATEFKFFFVLENSICKDYITEKFFSTLRFNVIPVVLGGGSYDYYVTFNFCIN